MKKTIEDRRSGKVIKDLQGEPLTLERLQQKEDIWIQAPNGREQGLIMKDLIPKECDECSFPAMEILSRDFENQELQVGCPWCQASRSLCLVCGKMAYVLDEHPHKNDKQSKKK